MPTKKENHQRGFNYVILDSGNGERIERETRLADTCYLSNNLSAFLDRNLLGRFTALASHLFNLVDNIQSLGNLAKDHMLSIEPRGVNGANEELTSVGTGSGVGHAQDSPAHVFEVKVFVIKLVAVNALSARTIVVGKVATKQIIE
jgi:hypothetical protein